MSLTLPPPSLSPSFIPVIHCNRQVFQTISYVSTGLLYISTYRSIDVTYDFVLASACIVHIIWIVLTTRANKRYICICKLKIDKSLSHTFV